MFDFLQDFAIQKALGVFTVLFVALDMPGNIPIVLSFFRGKRRIPVGRITSVAAAIIFLFWGVSHYLSDMLQIGLRYLALGGSLFLLFWGAQMVLGIELMSAGRARKGSILFPLVFPIIVGPVTFAMLLTLQKEQSVINIGAGILLNLLVMDAILRQISWLARLLGKQLLGVLSRVCGVFLILMAFKGIQDYFVAP